MRPQRRLLIAHRRIASESADRYDLAWSAFVSAAVESGAKAWRFRSAVTPTLHIEFCEYSTDRNPSETPGFARARAALEGIAPGETAEWIDANISK